MSRCDRLALLISLWAVLAAVGFSEQVFESIPHIEDEFTYVWQAQAVVGGHAILPSPPCGSCFTVPFVIDFQGIRFGKYPLGYPVILAAGLKLGTRHLVNPILSGFSLWLMYLLIKKVTDEKSALLASLLTLVSPFFLMNSSNLLSHAWSLFLSAGLANAWLDTVSPAPRRPRLSAAVAALCLGALALTRPLTALGVALPFGVHGLYILAMGNRSTRLRVAGIGLLAAMIASLHLLWQFALTGNALLNPYTLWWEKDALGFGSQVGYQPGGYHLGDVFVNMATSLRTGASDLFGWPYLSWIFLPFGVAALRRNKPALLVSSVFLSLVLAYTLYWSASWLYGPRYYYEGLFSLTLLSAAGIRSLANRGGNSQLLRVGEFILSRRSALMAALVAVLIAVNLLVYLPGRAASLSHLYGVTRKNLEVFSSPQALAATPALLIIHAQNWNEYYQFLELGDAYLQGPYLIAVNQGEGGNLLLASQYPERTVIHYYPDSPGKINFSPR